MKNKLLLAPIFKCPNSTKEFAIETDASQVGRLTQEHKIKGKKFFMPVL